MNIVGTNIKRLRQHLGDSQAAFGAQFGLNRGQIASYEAEEKYSSPAIETVVSIVDYFDIDLRAFITDPLCPVDGKANGKVTGKPSAEIQNDRDKKTETPTRGGVALAVGRGDAYITGDSIDVRPIVVVVDERNDELITLVEEPVFAGYQRGYGDKDFVAKLPTLRLPGLSGRTHRAFEVRGDSMQPTLQPRDIIVCSYVADFRFLRNDAVYVVVSPDAGLVVKRITNRVDQRSRPHIVCTSDNPEYPPFKLLASPDHISELWQVELRMTTYLLPPAPTPELTQRVTILEMQYQDLMERLQAPQQAHRSAFIED